MNKNESKYFNTAKKMNDALVSLLDEKDFEYITVKDVCSKAGVNRSTFYLHYENTYDVLEEVIQGLTKSFKDHMNTPENDVSVLNKSDLKDLYLINDSFLTPYLEFIKDNKKIYKAIKNNPKLFNANREYEKLFKYVFSPIMTRFGLDKKWHKYMMDYYTNGLSSVIIDWVSDDCVTDISEMVHFIEGLIIKYDEKDN